SFDCVSTGVKYDATCVMSFNIAGLRGAAREDGRNKRFCRRVTPMRVFEYIDTCDADIGLGRVCVRDIDDMAVSRDQFGRVDDPVLISHITAAYIDRRTLPQNDFAGVSAIGRQAHSAALRKEHIDASLHISCEG